LTLVFVYFLLYLDHIRPSKDLLNITRHFQFAVSRKGGGGRSEIHQVQADSFAIFHPAKIS